MNDIRHDVLSTGFELFRFDLRSREFPMGSYSLKIPVTRTGIAAAVVQWIDLDLDGISRYENWPSSHSRAENHWTQILYRFPQVFAVTAGDNVGLAVGHNRRQFWISRVSPQ